MCSYFQQFFNRSNCKTPFWNWEMPMDKFSEDSKLTRHPGAVIENTLPRSLQSLLSVHAARMRKTTIKKGSMAPSSSAKCKHTARFISVAFLVGLCNTTYKNAIYYLVFPQSAITISKPPWFGPMACLDFGAWPLWGAIWLKNSG